MAVYAEFYKDAGLKGTMESFTLDDGWRYEWIKFGSALSREISSLRAHSWAGAGGNVYGFTSGEQPFYGEFASLNMPDGWTCWWNYVGDHLNDQISSAILVNRSASELVLGLREFIEMPFEQKLDAKLKGTGASRSGAPAIYTLYWPGHDPSRIFVSVLQLLDVNISPGWDYQAVVRYDIYLYLSDVGTVQGYVAWVYVSVEGGLFSSTIFSRLQPKAVSGAADFTAELQRQLAGLSGFTFRDLYLLPGRPPSNQTGDIGNAVDDSTLVLVR